MSESPASTMAEDGTPDTQFVIELEDDPHKNEELIFPWEPLRSVGEPVNRPIEAPAFANYESRPNSGGSYLSFEFTTIQPLLDGKTLLVVRLHFHPVINAKFKNAVVRWEFLPPDAGPSSSSSSPAPRVVLHAPRKSYGGLTIEKRRIIWGLQLPLTVGVSPVNTGLSASSGHETEKEIEQSMTITGTARGTPLRKEVSWTIVENSSSNSGLPSEIQLGVVVEHQGPILCKVGVKGVVSRGLMPSRHLKSKAGPLGKGVVLNVDTYKGLLREYDFEGGSEEWKRLLSSWTGQVEDSFLPFGSF